MSATVLANGCKRKACLEHHPSLGRFELGANFEPQTTVVGGRNHNMSAQKDPWRILPIAEIAQRMACSERHVYKVIQRGAIRKLRGTRRVLVTERAFQDYLDGR